MMIEREYRGMAYTTEEQEKELGYSVILKYYREKECLIDKSEVYAMYIQSKVIYKKNKSEPEMYEQRAIISTSKDIANQVIEIFRINKVSPLLLNDVYEDMRQEARLD